MAFKRWLYKDGRPNPLTRWINSLYAAVSSLGVAPNYMVTLELPGRHSGKIISFPLVLLVMNQQRYLVSMLGSQANWVRNLEANAGQATLRHGKVEAIKLELVDVAQRAPITRAYLQIAPGARPHIPVDKDAPLADFEKIAAQFPVYRVTQR